MGTQPVLREEPSSHLYVRTFQPGDESDFRRLNEHWIAKYFGIEPGDLDVLTNVQQKIIDTGGQVFLAVLDGEVVGCGGLMNMGECSYEFIKMATDERYQRRGIARAVMSAAIDWAREHNVRRLYLETNHTLTPAIRLYESVGFKHIPPRATKYRRADVFMELWLEPEWVKCII